MGRADDQAREIAELRDRLSRLSQASLRINELQGCSLAFVWATDSS